MEYYIYIDGWKSNIRFSSAHIIPEYEKCGRLHGHTYAVHVKISGKPDNKGIIIDFSSIKQILRNIVNNLDHKILIPDNSDVAKIVKEKDIVKIFFYEKRYVLPLNDCVFLPIKSTSAENLASYVLTKFIGKINLQKNIEKIEITVDEGYGQGAIISKIFQKNCKE